jgi:hypothetical protein
MVSVIFLFCLPSSRLLSLLLPLRLRLLPSLPCSQLRVPHWTL